MGLVIILALGLYLAIAIGVIAWAVSHAKKNGKSAARWGWGAALGMYLLVFWDWLPTVAAHKYYCSTEAGFWVYKTPEQWKAENLNMRVLEYGESKSDDFSMERTEVGGNKTSFSTRATSYIQYTEILNPILLITKNRKLEEVLIDKKQKAILL